MSIARTTAFLALSLGAIAIAAPRAPLATAAVQPSAPLTAAELDELRIDLQAPSGVASLAASAAVSEATAEATGDGIVPGLVVQSTFRAYASEYEDPRFPVRPVVVVLYSGGIIPRDPAPGEVVNGPIVARLTGVIVDAETGEFMRGFMIP